ncbi:MAG: small multi-drug export protein [Oscillospiraceae bacterium]|jgi:uncharacterized membrane protein|nr:small multi-drug export protein [Oscillospiraceae bacterium]
MRLYNTLTLLAQATASPAAVPAAAQTAFVWTEHLGEIITTGLLSMVPTFEGRYAIEVGRLLGMPVLFAFILAFVCSSIPMPLIMWRLKPMLRWLYSRPWPIAQKAAAWVENRAVRKAKEVETGSLVALCLFVAVPLPGTGVWTGSIIATLLEMDVKRASVAIVLGNLGACLIMTLLGTGVRAIF